MNFKEFSQYLAQLEATSSRLEITSVLAELLDKASPAEIDKVCYLSLGRLGPLFANPQFNIASKMMVRTIARAVKMEEQEVSEEFKRVGDLGDAARNLKLKTQSTKLKSQSRNHSNLGAVYQTLFDIAKFGGAGSQEKKIRTLSKLVRETDPLSAKFTVRIVLGTMRTGFSDLTVLDALSWMVKGDKGLRSEIERAYNVYPDVGRAAFLVKTWGVKSLGKIAIEVGVPLMPQLCQRLNDPKEILEKHGGESAVETKFDGTRVQLHLMRGSRKGRGSKGSEGVEKVPLFAKPGEDVFVKTFTRNLEETTHQFPEIVAAAKKIKADSFILDGEAIGVKEGSGKFLSFQKTITRKRKHHIGEALKEVKLHYFVFDLLYLNGVSLLNEPFNERRRKLVELLKSLDSIIKPASQLIISNPSKLKARFLSEVRKGGEGIVAKDLKSPYSANGRGFSWIKYKHENESDLSDTIDVVVMGVFRGEGKRSTFGVGRLLAGIYDPKKDVFLTIAKVGSGPSDEEWRLLKRMSDSLKLKAKPINYEVAKFFSPDLWLRPELVISVRADNVTVSPMHTAGFSLRFPRLMKIRFDKSPTETTSLKEIKSIIGK